MPRSSTGRGSRLLAEEQPEGADGELWAMLSEEERIFFAKPGVVPPLLYGRTTVRPRPQPPTILGSRLDLLA